MVNESVDISSGLPGTTYAANQRCWGTLLIPPQRQGYIVCKYNMRAPDDYFVVASGGAVYPSFTDSASALANATWRFTGNSSVFYAHLAGFRGGVQLLWSTGSLSGAYAGFNCRLEITSVVNCPAGSFLTTKYCPPCTLEYFQNATNHVLNHCYACQSPCNIDDVTANVETHECTLTTNRECSPRPNSYFVCDMQQQMPGLRLNGHGYLYSGSRAGVYRANQSCFASVVLLPQQQFSLRCSYATRNDNDFFKMVSGVGSTFVFRDFDAMAQNLSQFQAISGTDSFTLLSLTHGLRLLWHTGPDAVDASVLTPGFACEFEVLNTTFCGPGDYLSTTAPARCLPCPPSTYQSVASHTLRLCINCPATFVNDPSLRTYCGWLVEW
jgi:hypothetical protein